MGLRHLAGTAVLTLVVGAAAACTPGPDPLTPSPSATRAPAPAPSEAPPVSPSAPGPPQLVPATDEPQDVLTGLTTPWSLAFLPGGAALITLRDPAQVLLLSEAGSEPLRGPGADELAATTTPGGEAGLLGVAVSPSFADDGVVHLYRTTASGNEVVRAVLDAATATLGPLEPVLTGIPAARNHDGGRIAFGPDGRLFVGTGDAGDPRSAQDEDSLAGKILRITADGEPAPGNPVEGSPVWSLGHRNVQGLGWDADGRMFASELGQNAFDELNVIEPGGNYGWPEVEGRGGGSAFVDPVTTWSTDLASPSGLAVTEDGVYLAALRGERLWAVGFLPDGFADAGDALEGRLGRLRDVVVGPDGALWVLTQNTDGRGTPRDGDDRLVRLLPP